MFKSLWFFTKIGLLIALAVWVADRPGQVVFDWMEYRIETTVGVVLFVILLLMIFSAYGYRLWRSIVTMPSWFKRYQEAKTKEKGYAALTRGLVAVAAGDTKVALKHSKRASKLIPQVSLTKLLSAQSSLMNNEHDKAQKQFYELIKDKEASFFGVRGLLTQTIRQGDHDKALQLVRQADSLQPKTKWILQTLLDLEIQARDWNAAEETLHKCYKAKAFDKKTYQKHQLAIEIAKAEVSKAKGLYDLALEHAKKAWKIDESFVPATEVYAYTLYELGDQKKAAKIIEGAWKINEHPDLVRAWQRIAPEDAKHEPLKMLSWAERLLKNRKESIEARLAVGVAALDAEVYGEARRYLEEVAKIHPGERVFLALSELEQRQFGDHDKANLWMQKAVEVNKEKEWTCRHCNTHSVKWSPICSNCGSFNTIAWGGYEYSSLSPHRLKMTEANGFIEPPFEESLTR